MGCTVIKTLGDEFVQLERIRLEFERVSRISLVIFEIDRVNWQSTKSAILVNYILSSIISVDGNN